MTTRPGHALHGSGGVVAGSFVASDDAFVGLQSPAGVRAFLVNVHGASWLAEWLSAGYRVVPATEHTATGLLDGYRVESA